MSVWLSCSADGGVNSDSDLVGVKDSAYDEDMGTLGAADEAE